MVEKVRQCSTCRIGGAAPDKTTGTDRDPVETMSRFKRCFEDCFFDYLFRNSGSELIEGRVKGRADEGYQVGFLDMIRSLEIPENLALRRAAFSA